MVDKKSTARFSELKEASITTEKAMDCLQQLRSDVIFRPYKSRVFLWHENQ